MGISAVIFALSAFFDMGYQCAKDTPRTLPAIFLAAVVNLVCNLVLVKYIGVYGAIITSIITYLVLFIYRLHDMKRYFKLSLYTSSIIAAVLIPVGAIPFYLVDAWWGLIVYMIAACILSYYSIPKGTREELIGKILQKTGYSKQ